MTKCVRPAVANDAILEEHMTAGTVSLATASTSGVATAQADDGFGSMSPADLVMPRIKIAQGLTAEVQDGKAKSGDILNSVTGENYGNTLNLVVLNYQKGQLYMVTGVGVQCRSSNGVVGVGNPGGACASCSLRAWGDGVPPLCSETHNYLVLLPEPLEVGMLTLQKTATKAAKLLNSMIVMNKQRAKARGENSAAWAMQYELTTRVQESKKGKFYVPAIRQIGACDEGLLAYATELAESFSTRDLDFSEAESDAGAPVDMPTKF